MDNGSGKLKQIKVNPERLKKFQLPRSYTIDSWSVEIDVSGKSINQNSNNNTKSLKPFKPLQLNHKLKTVLEDTDQNKTTKKYKWTSFIIFVALILSIILLIFALTKSKKNNICLTSVCVRTAALTLQYMDPTIDPCNNFYDFACGNFGSDLPNTETTNSVLGKGDDLIQNQLKSFFTEPLPADTFRAFKNLQRVHNNCANNNHVSLQDEINSLKVYINFLGGWPMAMGNLWNENPDNIVQLTSKLRILGVPYNYLINVYLNECADNAKYYQIYISSVEHVPSVDGDTLEIMAKLLGGNETIIKKDLADVMLFTNELQKIPNKATSINIAITIKELQTRFPEINWLMYINTVVNLPEFKFTEDKIIRLTASSMKDLLKLIFNTPKRILFNYILSKVVLFATNYLPKFKDNYLHSTLNHFEIAIQSIPLAINYWYVKKYFNKETENKVQEILTNVKNEFGKTLENTKWLDNATKVYALEKLNLLTVIIGYPKELLNITVLESYYQALDIELNSCLQAVSTANKFNIDKQFKKLDLPFVRDWEIFGKRATSINATYNRVTNKIFIPAALIVNLVYNKQRPNYVNYGTLGFIIGRELTFAFDSNETLHGSYGWLNETIQLFQQKAQCMIEQYNNFTVFNTSVHGDLTLAENIADNGGLKYAYYAYQHWLKQNDKEENLPGLNFTDKQIFWLSFAQTWCERTTELYFKKRVPTDCYVPNRYRIIGTLNNIESFSKDFNCPLNSSMNPVKKCTVW